MRWSDLIRQSFRAITKHKKRNGLSTFGIAWGVAAVLILAGWGVGIRDLIRGGMADLGDNIIFIFPGHTSVGVGGYRAGRPVLIYPEDIDVIEVHDATSPAEIMDLVELDICPGEDAPKWIDEGTLEVNGRKPSNPSGGLVTKGHPVGATGAAQLYEIWEQLRGRAGKRQVPIKNLRIGAAHNLGGTGGTSTFTILERR